MKPELIWLIWAVLLTFALTMVASFGAVRQVGLPRQAGNREGMPEIVGWAGRAARAQRNLLENMILFVPLVLIAVVAERTSATTLLGAQVFVVARLAHAVFYIAGIGWLRTVAFAVSITAMALILLQLV